MVLTYFGFCTDSYGNVSGEYPKHYGWSNGIYAGGGVWGGSNAIALLNQMPMVFGKALPGFLALVEVTLFS